MGFLWVIVKAILKKFAELLQASMPPELRKPIDFIAKLKKPFNFLGTNTKEKQAAEKGIKGLIKRIMKMILKKFVSILKIIGKFCVACAEPLLIVLAVVLIGVMLTAILGAFGAFNGRINIEFDKFEELNADETIYMDAQNTNELRKAYMQLVSETSYYQVFNLRDLNPNSMNPYLEVMAKVVNKLYDWGLTDTELKPEDLNYYNMSRTFLGWVTQDERYIYSDANKNALKYMKLPKVTGIGVDVGDLVTTMNTVNDNFRDYYNRETTFQLSENLLSEMNRILFGEFSNVETITYPEAFVKPVAFVNDFYRIQDTGKFDNIGQPYVYVTQRVTLNDINNSSSFYYEKDWLEGIIKSDPSHIVYDYVVEQKNNYYWSEADNDLATQMAWGNIGKYATVSEELEYEDGTTVDKESAMKLYWIVKDSEIGTGSVTDETDYNNPYNEHMGATITNKNYTTYFDGPYTRLNLSPGSVSVDTTSKICDVGKAVVYVNPENGNESDTYHDGWVKVRCEYNKYPLRHMQLVSIFDENGEMQVNSRVLFNKTFVQKKSVRESYRYFPEYFSGFEDFANTDLNRMSPAMGVEVFFPSSDDEIENGTGNCTAAMYEEDAKKPFSERKCSIIRRYTGTNGYAYLRAKFREWGQGIANFFTGEDKEAEINISSEAMFYLLLAYDDYIIETGEYGVAWDYKYYTATALDLEFAKAQYRDIFGFKEIFVDSWNDTAVYKDTLDTVKALDNQRTVSTTYVPTSIISGQTALYKDASGNQNNNNNNTGYGWKVDDIASSAGAQTLERVKGEASLEMPQYSTGSLVEMLRKYLANGVYFGEEDFRFSYDSTGDIIDSGDKSWESYIAGLDNEVADADKVKDEDGNNISVEEALKAYNEGGDWRNTTEAWDPYAKVYRPSNSENIHTNITSGITTWPYGGRVSYRTYQGDYLPYETKSVRDYGLGSVLSYIQDMRVVYQTGVYMDETYVGKSAFETSFENITGLGDNFSREGNGYYPKELLDEYPTLMDALSSTPIPVEDLMSLAQNIVSLQYAATDYEMDEAEKAAGDGASYEAIRDELVKIIAGRNMNGVYIGDNENKDGFPLISASELDTGVKGDSTDICKSAYDECKDIDEDADSEYQTCISNRESNCSHIHEDDEEGLKLCIMSQQEICDKKYNEKQEDLKACLLEKQDAGMYFNEGLFDCERRCETEAMTSARALHPDLNDEERAEEESKINEKKNDCLEVCKKDWPDLSQVCSYSTSADKLKGVYAYGPYLKDTYWENFKDKLFGWFLSGANTYSQVQFLDPLQYYIEWFDFKAEDEDSIISKVLHFIEGSDFVTQIHVAGSAYLQSIKNDNSGFASVSVDKHFLNIGSDFAQNNIIAGKKIVGEFKQDFYNKYSQDLEPMNLILENESYRIYMIDEAVTFLGTFTYTYKNDIANIGGGISDRQVSGLAYADRYYYLSNYIFNIPYIEYEIEKIGGGEGSWSKSVPSCSSVSVPSIEDAESTLNGFNLFDISTWFAPDVKVMDTGKTCHVDSRYVPDTCYRPCTVPCTVNGQPSTCSSTCSYDCSYYEYRTEYNFYATVGKYVEAKDGYIVDTPSEIDSLIGKDSSLKNDIYIGMKVYESLGDWSWSASTNSETDLNPKFSHEYESDYSNTALTTFVGDDENHYNNIAHVNKNIIGRKGYYVNSDEVTNVDGKKLPDDLHMSINLSNYDEIDSADTLEEADLERVLAAAKLVKPYEEVEISKTDDYGTVTLTGGKELTDDFEDIGVGLMVANREEYGYPIPLFRHFAGVMREILPRQRGYYFNGEVFDSWNSRLILTDDTTPAQKQAILDEKNETQSYLYDYIMNFEAYVPMDVKSDYDLMSRARDAYHSTMSTKVNHVENTAVLSSDIYNIANSDAWKETIKKFGSEMDATTVSQLISGLLEVSIDRAPRKMITILNQNITDDAKKVADTTGNRSIIENAVNASLNGGNSILSSSTGTANLNNSLFLGDSQTQGMEGLGLFSGTGATVNAERGRGISGTNSAAQGYSGYSKVFINIGVNDAKNADSTFKSQYKTLVETVKSNNPSATIYLGSIPAMDDTKAEGVTTVRNADINKKNQIIQQVAAELNVNFMDVHSHLGTMDASDTVDGLHLASHKYQQWFNFISATVGTSSGSSALDVTLTLEDGTSQTFRLTDLGPGVIFYNYNVDKNGNPPTAKTISTSDIHVTCGTGTEYSVCFDDVSLNISDTIDERLDKNKALQYVSTKLGKLIQKYGDVKYAILAYFHGEGYATAVQAKGEGGTWFNGDDADKIADVLAELTGDESVRMNADNINTFMYSGTIVTDVMGYIQDTANKTILNNAAVIPAAAAGVPLGTNKDFPMDVYTKWQPLFDTFCAKYEVDVALAVAMFTQESAGNAFAGLCGGDSITTYTVGATPTCTDLNTNKYNGGGGIGQIHHICDSGSGKKNLDSGGTCTRTITSQKTGDTVVVNMANPKNEVSSMSDMSSFLAKDDRYGNVEKAFEWAIILISNLLNESNNDAFLAAARYNGWPDGCSTTDPNWYTCYSSKRNEYTTYPDYVKHIARYYLEDLATAELTTNFGVSGATGAASFGLQTGNLSYQRDMFQIQNSGVELYIPRMTTSRNDVTTLILNVSNFGKEDYYMYANEHNLLDFFTERLEDGDAANSMLGGNPQISQLGKKSSKSIDPSYKFAYMTPLIPMQSPIGSQTNSDQLKVTSEFGYRNKIVNDVVTSEIAMHNGVDLGYVNGTKVLAAAEGRVSIAQYHSSYGNYVEIEHTVPANTVITDSSGTRYQIIGLYTRYAHMTHYNVNVGDVIRTSCSSGGGSGKCLTLTDAIGEVGNTGNSTGNHLHFEVLVKARNLDTGELLPETAANTKCDPYYWLTTKWTQGVSLVEGALDDAQINSYIDTIRAQYPSLSNTRETFIRNALSLVGKVRYYYGGESTAYGWDPQWGQPAPTSYSWYDYNLEKGRTIWGLDCSEFIQWVYRNTFNEEYADGVNGQWNMAAEGAGKVNLTSPQPGDLAVTSDKGHIGIYLYTDENGKKVYVHCGDPVKVEPYSKFVNFFTINKLGQ